MLFIYIIILSLFMYLFFIIAKYSGTEKPDYKLEYYRDKENIKLLKVLRNRQKQLTEVRK